VDDDFVNFVKVCFLFSYDGLGGVCCPASNAIHGHINDFLVRTGLRSGVSELQLPCFTAVRAEIALMSGSAFAVTHHPVSS